MDTKAVASPHGNEKTRPTVDLPEWPDALIRAVVQAAPELIRSDDPYAVREQDLEAYARDLALVSLEEEDIKYLDVPAYAAEVRDSSFRRFDVAGEVWYVADWERSQPEVALELPIKVQAPLLSEWPDELITAVGRQAPALLKTLHGDTWAIAETDFRRFALYWLFEGYCEPSLYRHVDVDRFDADQRARFTRVEDEGAVWYVDVDEHDHLVRPDEADPKDAIHVPEWPASLIAAVAAAWPETFRASDYESIIAVPDEHLEKMLTEWAERNTDEVERAGALAAWIESVRDRELRPVEAEGRHWWVHIHEWAKPATAVASSECMS